MQVLQSVLLMPRDAHSSCAACDSKPAATSFSFALSVSNTWWCCCLFMSTMAASHLRIIQASGYHSSTTRMGPQLESGRLLVGTHLKDSG
jgi:hypothetical protein